MGEFTGRDDVDGDAFTDRQAALDAFDRFLADGNARVLIYWGLAGQGKSALLRELVRAAPPGRRRALIDLDGLLDFDDRRTAASDLIEVVVRRIGDVLLDGRGPRRIRRRYRFNRALRKARPAARRDKVDVALTATNGGRISGSHINVYGGTGYGGSGRAADADYHRDLLAAMTRALAGLRRPDTVLLFDTTERLRYLDDSTIFERSSSAVRHWFVAELVPQLCAAVPDLKIVLAGREDVRIPSSIEARSVELTEWSREDTTEFLRRRGVTAPEVVRAVHDYCQGVPVWTSLMADLYRERGGDLSEAWLATASRNRLAGEWLPREFLRRLAPERRAVVLAASVLRVVRKEAIEFLLGDDPRPAGANWYAELLEQSFVRTAYGVDGSRESRVHQLVRAAVLEYLRHDEPARFDALQRRAAEYFTGQGAFLDEAYHRFAAGDTALADAWRDRIGSALGRRESGAVLTLTTVVLAPEVTERLTGVAPELVGHAEYAAGQIAYHQGHPDEAAPLLSRALDRDAGEDAGYRAAALELLADIALLGGDLDAAQARYAAELSVARRLDQVAEQVGALSGLGDVARRRRRLAEATERYEEALALARSHGHHLRHGKILRTLGRVAMQQGDLDAAETRYRAALAELDKTGDSLERARTLNALGELETQRGDYPRALEWLDQSLAICRSVANPHHEANGLLLVADALVGLGDPGRAVEQYDAALRIFDRTGGLLGRARVLRGLGDAAIAQREAAVAAEWYGQAGEAFRRVDGRLGEARAAYARWFAMAKADAPGHQEARVAADRLLVESHSDDLRRRVAAQVEALWINGRGPRGQD
ncbi:tetratricopeptide repeat protein [Rhizomonospora bruguierae]|uniref:tetratricopeptide repeat protein n=1 Tax=Rhizomonospora bruguierae TaxID=1581705 RepID=UPI001BCBD80E|nr:tetratricopeptide repeat protein [Micromonospora sp. NBRC 107566]